MPNPGHGSCENAPLGIPRLQSSSNGRSDLTRGMDALAERAGSGTESPSVRAKARDLLAAASANASADVSADAPVEARGAAATISRWLNFVLALLALIAVLPLLLLIAVAI